jgi:selenide,water dikinase
MTTLNRAAAEVITRANDQRPTTNDGFPVHALTDITGFGLIGHAREMARASNVSLKIQASRVPILPGAIECVRSNYIPGGLKANREFAECVVQYDDAVPDDVKTLLFDPQTAGGLLISVAVEGASDLLRALKGAGVAAVDIGEILPPGKPLIHVTL